MKLHLNLLLALFTGFVAYSQATIDGQITQLQSELKRAKGQNLMRGAIKLADLYASNSQYNKSMEWLDKACKEAKRSRRKPTIVQVNLAKAERILSWPSNNSFLDDAVEAIETSIDQKVPNLEDRHLDLLNKLAASSSSNSLSRRIRKNIAELNEQKKLLAVQDIQEEEERDREEFLDQSDEQKYLVLKSLQEGLATTTEELQEITVKSRREYMRQREELTKTRSKLDESETENDSLFYELLNYQDSMLAYQKTELELQKIELDLQEERLHSQELELSHQNQRRNALVMAGLAVIVFLISLFLYMRYQTASKHGKALQAKNELIEEEKKKSDDLLLNILPLDVAYELKEYGKVQTQYFDSATVLFADFVKFSKIAQNVSPEKLIEDLDYCFGKFDEILIEHGVEKIKTIGDSYMCVTGVPKPQKDHADRMIKATMDMQAFLEIWNASRKEDGLPEFRARFGIHSGPVIAGVVGKTKFAYDIWGDTVNIADRMQEAGAPGEINISKDTQKLLNGNFKLEYRGKLQIKNMADIDGYFVRV